MGLLELFCQVDDFWLSFVQQWEAAINIVIQAGWVTPLQRNVGDFAVRGVEAAGL